MYVRVHVRISITWVGQSKCQNMNYYMWEDLPEDISEDMSVIVSVDLDIICFNIDVRINARTISNIYLYQNWIRINFRMYVCVCVSILVVGIRITGRKVILNILEMWFVSVIRSQHEARNEATMRPRPSPLFRFCSFFPFCPFHPCLFLSSFSFVFVIFFLPLIVVFSVAVPFWNFFFHVFSSFPFSLASSFPLPFLFASPTDHCISVGRSGN